MNIFRNRPLAAAECMMALVALLAFRMEGTFKLVFLALSACSLLLLFLLAFKRRKSDPVRAHRFFVACLCLLLVSAALLGSFVFFDAYCGKRNRRVGNECQVEGIVLHRTASTPYSGGFDVLLSSVNGGPERTLAVLETEYASLLQAGDRFVASVTPRQFAKAGDFDEELFRLANGCTTVLVCGESDHLEVIGAERDRLDVRLSLWNTQLSSRLYYALGEGDEAGIAVALLLGNRSFLSDRAILQFRRTGISHLLALSGLHLSILVGALEFLLRRLRLPMVVRASVIPAAALSYLLLTGGSLSTARAALMVTVLYLGSGFGARYDSFTAICTALAGILLAMPYAILDAGMWMSFLAAGSIVIFIPPLNEFLEKRRSRSHLPILLSSALSKLCLALAVGVVANLGLLLLISFLYGEVSLLSVPMTMALSLPVSVLLILSIPALLLPSLTPLCVACAFVAKGMLWCIGRASELSDILLPVGDLPTRVCLAFLTVALVLLAVPALPLRRWIWWALPPMLAVLAVCTSLGVTHLSDDGIRMRYLGEGRGSVLLFSEHGRAVAIDLTAGSASAMEVLADAAREARCSQIDDLILTRYANTGAYFLDCIATGIRVCRLHLPEPLDDKERSIAHRLEQVAHLNGMEVIYGVEDIELLDHVELLRAPAEETAHRAILLRVLARGRELVYLNGAVAASELRERAYLAGEHCDLLMLDATGQTKSNQAQRWILPASSGLILLEGESLRCMLPAGHPEERVICGVEQVDFVLKKSRFSGDGNRLFFIPC